MVRSTKVRLSGTPEYAAVVTHRQSIITAYKTKHATYRDMAFYPDWNPSVSGRGAYSRGAQWILDHLGPKPGPDFELHIVERSRGFVPGNLRWIPRGVHKQAELLRTVLLENQQLWARVMELENRLKTSS
jgi:hypothetical protein